MTCALYAKSHREPDGGLHSEQILQMRSTVFSFLIYLQDLYLAPQFGQFVLMECCTWLNLNCEVKDIIGFVLPNVNYYFVP